MAIPDVEILAVCLFTVLLPRDAAQSAVVRQYVVRPSVCLSVRNV